MRIVDGIGRTVDSKAWSKLDVTHGKFQDLLCNADNKGIPLTLAASPYSRK